ncbi:MAG: hypothetical protein C4524_08580 [Candidatus Zixiibacteriota bacterium]|nr:MAG: hypothetical protein C4524_08580 [candidate division Zixibacteria bacterium]
MNYLRGSMGVLLLAAMSLLLVNCDQKSSTGPSNGGTVNIIGAVTVTTPDQYLYALPMQSATATITATVSDTEGQALPGIVVTFTSPDLGSVSTSKDTTDLDGKVSVSFNSEGEFGDATIKAEVTSGGLVTTGTVTLHVTALTGFASQINLSLAPDQLFLAAGEEDSIKATVRVYDSQGVGIPGLQVNLSTNLGVLALAGTTNNAGTVVTYIHSNQQYGMGLVTASVLTLTPDTGDGLTGTAPSTWPKLKTGEVLISGLGLPEGSIPPEPPGLDDVTTISDVDTFWVFDVGQQIASLTISAAPTSFFVSPGSIGSSMITAIVQDEQNNGLVGVPVSFATDMGLLTSNTGVTDSAGMKTTLYQSLPYTTGKGKVWAVVGNLSDTCEIEVKPTSQSNGSLQLFSDTNVIYADNGITFATLSALLKDQDYQVIANASIIFTSDFGTVNSPVLTDLNGLAQATFQAYGEYSFPDSAMIIAKYNELGISDTVYITIMPERTTDHIVLNAATNSITANGLDSTRVDATVYLENNALAPNGTQIHFYVGGENIGDISTPITQVGAAGTATVYYHAGISTGVDTLYAEVEGIYSNPVPVTLHAGPPSNVMVTVTPSTLPVGSMTSATVTAVVTDTTGNLVQNNVGVLFTTSRGSINPPEAPTVNGVATSYLSPLTSAGPAWVKAQVNMLIDSTLVTFVPSGPMLISLSSTLPSITVAGAGGTNFTPINAMIRDAAGNLVGNDVMVHFQILGGAGLGGININNHGLQDSTLTAGGIATVVLNAGTVSGPVQIKAWTYNGSTLITTQQSLVTVVAGPPAFIDINSMSDPQDGGGDTWRVEVSALVLDEYGNQVPDSVSVSFYQLPQTIGQIQGAGFTGNENWNGDTYPGVAFTSLTYHSDETFDTISVVAYCMVGEDSVIGSQGYLLPLADGDLSLAVDPIAYNFSHPPQGGSLDTAVMKCIAYLIDGHGNPINNATIVFFSTRGYYNWYPTPFASTWRSQKLTGPGTLPYTQWPEPFDSTGYAITYLITTESQAFPDPGAMETTGQVHCQVEGFWDVTSDPITVTYTRDAP